MKGRYFSWEQDGFYGVYYKNSKPSSKAFIVMLGDASDDRLAKSGVKYLQHYGCNVMTMSFAKKDYGYHSYPIEAYGKAIEVLKREGNNKFGVLGASTTGMLALVAASYYRDITLTIALTPCDFIMEGFLQDGLDGAKERPADGEATVSVNGRSLPFLPYAYRHPEYYFRVMKESKAGGDIMASRQLFENSEKLCPVTEEMKIKVENIRGRLVLVGAEDDSMWDTCRYIRRIRQRLEVMPHECETDYLLYQHGTHFVFPDSMLRSLVPLLSGLLLRVCFRAARKYPRECRETRNDIEKKLDKILSSW